MVCEIKSSIEMLNNQREKRQRRRELLHADREDIYRKIQHLNRLEHLDIELDTRNMYEFQAEQLPSKSQFTLKMCSNTCSGAQKTEDHHEQKVSGDGCSELQLLSQKTSAKSLPPLSATVSFVKKYARAVFFGSPEKSGAKSERNIEDKMGKYDKRGNTSILEFVDGAPGLSGKVRSNAREATDGRPDLEETHEMTHNLLQLDRNG